MESRVRAANSFGTSGRGGRGVHGGGCPQPGAWGATSRRCLTLLFCPSALYGVVLPSVCVTAAFSFLFPLSKPYLDVQEAFHIDREMSENGGCGPWYSLGILAQGCFRKFKFSSVGNAKHFMCRNC